MNTIKEFQQVRDWAEERGLYAKGDVKTQYIKLCEEAGEVARAIIKKDDKEFKDGLGDMVVVLVNLAHIYGTSLEECLALAYAEIKNRTGSMQNGSFVKDEIQKSEDEYYICRGLREKAASSWANKFEIGKQYKKVESLYSGDILGFIPIAGGNILYVDADQFELLPF